MEEELKQLIADLQKARRTADLILSDCPDVKEGKLIEKAIREINTAMEFVVSAKHYKSNLLDPRFKK